VGLAPLDPPYEIEADLMKGPMKFALGAAFVGLALMVLFWATGGGSVEPHHHPGWWLSFVSTPVGEFVWLVLTILCMPTLLLVAGFAALGVTGWGTGFWITACLLQGALYFVVSLTLAVWLKIWRESKRRT
jgi:hypothetical protein